MKDDVYYDYEDYKYQHYMPEEEKQKYREEVNYR